MSHVSLFQDVSILILKVSQKDDNANNGDIPVQGYRGRYKRYVRYSVENADGFRNASCYAVTTTTPHWSWPPRAVDSGMLRARETSEPKRADFCILALPGVRASVVDHDDAQGVPANARRSGSELLAMIRLCIVLPPSESVLAFSPDLRNTVSASSFDTAVVLL